MLIKYNPMALSEDAANAIGEALDYPPEYCSSTLHERTFHDFAHNVDGALENLRVCTRGVGQARRRVR